ncbi:hypothetical protein K440DRAFT_332782 [Wilcoxina mikolae CBS 423.85]|nr:hypothetical protein K440DRAFT_332782 [Wilcoxina mikolae CBS 423.85]
MVDQDLPKRFAILIGIDFYSHGNARQDAKVKYHTLRGCVRDVDAVEDYIMNRLSVEKDCIRKLTASVPGDVQQNKPVEDVNTIPTYDNMVRAIKFVTEFASPGDLIYIHYSGHGAKVATIFTDLKGNTGIDEALVPTDICTGGRYLRDIEFRSLLAEMVHKQLNVTVTLDCCHSGVVATEGVVCRGISQVDATRLPSDEISGIPHYRILPKKQSWLLEPDGYDLFAAAHQNGKAYEMVFPGVRGGCHGALTYWMLDTLISRGNSTNRLLYQTTTNNIRARDPGNQCAAPQVPYFAGNAERYFYGFEDTQNTSSIAVGHVKGRRMTHIYAPYKGEYQIHQVKAVDRLYAMDWGKFSSDIAPLVFEPSRSTNDYKSNNFDTFTVEVNRDGMYELWSRTGTCIQPVPEFVPCSIADIFLSRMARVAQYQVIKDLKGTEHALMNGKLLLRVKGYEYDGSNETILDVKHGHQITMVFENHSEVGVYLTIFDLQPLWGITQIYPDVMDSEYVGPGHKREICMEVTLPAGITSDTAVDIIKAFATIDRMSFRALEIEDIDIHPDTEGPVERHSGLSTQSLYDQLTTTNGDATTEGSCARVWQTAQISVRVSRSLDRDYRHPGSLNDVEENLDGQELVAREIANHLSTVIVTGIRDLVILPAPNHTKPGILKEMVQKVFNPGMSQSGNVMWRCMRKEIHRDHSIRSGGEVPELPDCTTCDHTIIS